MNNIISKLIPSSTSPLGRGWGTTSVFIALTAAIFPVYAQSDIEMRVSRLEQIQQNRQQFDNVNQMIQLQEAVEQLRGEVEVQAKTLQELTNRQQLLYQDLDQRMQALEKAGKPTTASAATSISPLTSTTTNTSSAPAVAASSTPPATSANTSTPATTGSLASTQATTTNTASTSSETTPLTAAGTSTATTTSAPANTVTSTPATSIVTASDAMQEQAVYQQAYQNLLDKNYDQALTGLNSYLQTYPQGRYRANAYYWQGEVYLIKNNPQQAQQSFNTVVKDFPDNPKAADALLKLGYSYASLGDKEQAKTILNQVVTKYPNTALSNLAQARLAEL
ncbi:MAG: tol-pal system protein YbgF [Gammaproteobacteria bacterium]